MIMGLVVGMVMVCGCSKSESAAQSDRYTNSNSGELKTRLELAEWAYDAGQAQAAMDQYSNTYGGQPSGVDPSRMSQSSLFAVTNDIASNFLAQVNGALK